MIKRSETLGFIFMGGEVGVIISTDFIYRRRLYCSLVAIFKYSKRVSEH